MGHPNLGESIPGTLWIFGLQMIGRNAASESSLLRRLKYETWSARVTVEELVCAAILAFFAIQGALPFLAPHQSLDATHLPATGRMFYGGIGSQVVVYATIAYLLLRRARELAAHLWAMQWMLPLAALAVVSTLWSQFPAYSARRSLAFVMAGGFGLYLAVRFPLWRQLRIFRITMLALAVGTVVMVLVFPQLGHDASAGHAMDWQGVFTQKNACGRMMVVATAVLLADWRTTWRRVASLALFAVVMVMSGSRSAWLIEAALLALWGVLRVAQRMDAKSRVITLASVLALLPVACGAVYAALPVLLQWMGRSATLTGRTLIWKQVWVFIGQRPWLGWGYDGFWHGARGAAFRVDAALGFTVFHAQNGYLELWLELGLVGLVLFVLSYARAWRRIWPVLRRGEVDVVLWPVFVLALIFLYDLDEISLLIYNGIFWSLFVSALANIELLARPEMAESTMPSSERIADAAGVVVSQ